MLGRPTRILRWPLLALAVLGGGGVAGWVANGRVQRAAEGRLYRDAGDVPPRSVAIVLGARVYPDGSPSAILADRLQAALALYRQGKVRRILVSGDHSRRAYDETNAMRRYLLDHGVPSEDVFMDHAGLRTLDTMQRARRVFEVRDAVVCTQAFHLPRALYLARASGLDAVGLAADRRRYASARYNDLREWLARAGAVVDVQLGRGPKHLGAKIPINGSAARTHDDATRRL